MRYEEVPIEKIKVGDRAREDLGDLEGLAATIKDKGILQPLVVDQYYRLLAGERRLRAAGLAELKVVPVAVTDATGKLDSLEIEYIENTARKDFTWQERAMLEKAMFEKKADSDPNWSREKQGQLGGTGHSAVSRRIKLAEAFETLPDLAEFETEGEAYKALNALEEEFVLQAMIAKTPHEVKHAAKWASDHYVVGDSFIKMKECQNGIADFAEVDPPFGVDIIEDRKARNKDKGGHKNYNEWPAESYEARYQEMAAEVFRILKGNAFAVFWFGPTWWSETRDILRAVGFSVPDIAAVWTKGAVGQTASPDTNFGSCYEPFWLARKGNAKLAKPGRSNVFAYSPLSPTKKIHATEKPLDLLQEIISVCVTPGSAILVPFLGSGVTLRAAYSLGHTGWGYDLSKANKDLFLHKVYEDQNETQNEAD